MPPTMVSEKVLSWASIVDENTLAQAAQTASLPFIFSHLALMPDAHVGIGATVGSVIATEGAIIPAAVGVDIGCGMIAAKTNLKRTDLPEDLSGLLKEIDRAVPAGVGEGHLKASPESEAWLEQNPNETVTKLNWGDLTKTQFGTLGSGNHFIEVSVDPEDTVWVVLHSGSRGVGNKLASRHIDIARHLAVKWFIPLPDRDLAYFPENTEEFGLYVRDLMWAQKYAAASREQMLHKVIRQILDLAPQVQIVQEINCHHNYAAKEHHMGRDLWVTRKGAIRARVGDFGVIPGSMGTNSFIVSGLGNPASFCSAAHGAGRRMSRGEARKTYNAEALELAMKARGYAITYLDKSAKELVDEIPAAYKDIEQVMEDQSDLVKIETMLVQVLNFKGVK